MDMACIGTKVLKKRGLVNNLDESEEINACSIEVPVVIDGKTEQWLVQFKNETHNHPTEIEPFGGAATCLGGAIRDPLSGRAYVYQAMRVTGSGDPTTPFEKTLEAKLPQSKITTGAAAGYSSYGNQIGLATGQVTELYDEGYVAKRMEIGAVIGASPKDNVKRECPQKDDVIVLLGGRTGRDGCGGATGSSKAHNSSSIETCGAEVQKGNPPTERKIQRLFRKAEVAKMIKRCNDFGAGGVSVAIGELADGLKIDLDKVPKKYDGLDGTELAISESQERMAVVLDKADVDTFIRLSNEENLEATPVAVVTDENRLEMTWRGDKIVDLSRDFLNTNGVTQHAKVEITAVDENKNYRKEVPAALDNLSLANALKANLSRLEVCSQKGLVERFDSSIGASTVLMPYAGKYQLTPEEAMVAKIPLLEGETDTATVICVEDPLREEAADAVRELKEAGITKVVMMTGDSERTAAAIAKRVGVDEYYSEVLPEDKASFVEKEKELGHKVIMIGDGINDSLALSSASVGIAISDGAAIAREIADVTISADNLHEIVTLKRLSTALMKRIHNNYRTIIGINGGLIALGVTGIIMPTTSALLHNMSTLTISLRSMRNLLPKEEEA